MTLAHNLTRRDLELVVRLARGHTTDRVAREFRLSRHTVGERISSLLSRLNCKNRAELVAYCYAHGLLPTGVWPPGGQTDPAGDEPHPDGPSRPLAARPVPIGGRSDEGPDRWRDCVSNEGDGSEWLSTHSLPYGPEAAPLTS